MSNVACEREDELLTTEEQEEHENLFLCELGQRRMVGVEKAHFIRFCRARKGRFQERLSLLTETLNPLIPLYHSANYSLSFSVSLVTETTKAPVNFSSDIYPVAGDGVCYEYSGQSAAKLGNE